MTIQKTSEKTGCRGCFKKAASGCVILFLSVLATMGVTYRELKKKNPKHPIAGVFFDQVYSCGDSNRSAFVGTDLLQTTDEGIFVFSDQKHTGSYGGQLDFNAATNAAKYFCETGHLPKNPEALGENIQLTFDN